MMFRRENRKVDMLETQGMGLTYEQSAPKLRVFLGQLLRDHSRVNRERNPIKARKGSVVFPPEDHIRRRTQLCSFGGYEWRQIGQQKYTGLGFLPPEQ